MNPFQSLFYKLGKWGSKISTFIGLCWGLSEKVHDEK